MEYLHAVARHTGSTGCRRGAAGGKGIGAAQLLDREMRRAAARAIAKISELAYCCGQTGADEGDAGFCVAVNWSAKVSGQKVVFVDLRR